MDRSTTENGAATAPDLSVVLPVHNDGIYLADTVRAYCDMFDRMGRTYELVLVTNACTDESPSICALLASERPNVRHLDLEPGGWGRAVRAGLRAADGRSVCYTNLARTSETTLGLLVSYSVAFPDVVVKASRRIRDSWRRRLGSVLYNLECRMLFDTAIWDVNGTPKVFPRRFVRLLELERDDDLIDAEFVMRCRQEHYPIIDVPVLQTFRHGGKSTTGYGSALRLYYGAMRLKARERNRPT